MLDSNITVTKMETKVYPPLPENIYQVELLDINSKEQQTYDARISGGDETEVVMSFQFTILKGQSRDENLRGRNVWANFIPVYLYVGKNGKNKLYQIIEAVLGRELTLEEEANGVTGDFLNELIGKQCRIGTKHKQSGDKVFDNIDTYYPSETDETSLNDEEKEEARVKNNKGEGVSDEDLKTENDVKEEGLKASDIPF